MFLDWLQQYDHEKNPPKRYKNGSTLVGVKHFSAFNPVYLSSESHKRSYLDTIVLYMQSLEDLYTLWQLGVIDNTFATSERSQFEMKYPLSPQQRAIYSRYLSLVQTHRRQIYGTW